MSRKAPAVVWGIDPGNDSSGVSMWVDGECRWHATVKPWELYFQMQPELHHAEWQRRHLVFVEESRQGTYKTRQGISFAAGMLVSWIGLMVTEAGGTLLRRNVKTVAPHEWRSALQIVPDDREDAKSTAVERVEQMGLFSIVSHDEAEAILIGKYGCMELGIGLEEEA